MTKDEYLKIRTAADEYAKLEQTNAFLQTEKNVFDGLIENQIAIAFIGNTKHVDIPAYMKHDVAEFIVGKFMDQITRNRERMRAITCPAGTVEH